MLTFPAADSCNLSRPLSLVGELLEWLSLVFCEKFKMEKGGSFECGQQTDNLSCGLFAMNAIRHDVLKESLLDQKGIRHERVRWFNALCQTAYETVWGFHSAHSRDCLTRFWDRRIWMILNYKSFKNTMPVIRHKSQSGIEWMWHPC